MAKRSNMPRRANDAYDTPDNAIEPLLKYLPEGSSFIEPCAGKGNMTEFLVDRGFRCFLSSDIEPRSDGVSKIDAFDIPEADANYVITNPPWTRDILHPMIMHFKRLATAWLLFDADWAHTQQSQEYIKYCDLIVPIGRVKWIEDSPHTSKDNACWYRFRNEPVEATVFVGRA